VNTWFCARGSVSPSLVPTFNHSTTYECESRGAAVLWAETVGLTQKGLHSCGKLVF
jgi:hypothetical protein